MKLVNMRLFYEIETIEKRYKKYIPDIKKINQALFNHYGIVGNFEEVYDLWLETSNYFGTNWFTVPNDENKIILMLKESIITRYQI